MWGKSRHDLEYFFGFRRLKRLEREVGRQSALRPEDFRRAVEQKAQGLVHRLTMALSEPSWGPRLTPALHAGAQATDAGEGFLDGGDLQTVHVNLETSHRYFRYRALYLIAALLGLAVTLGALYVDYEIMNEFWTRILADEFLEVPANLANSVVSKSAQVIFATAAFHFFLGRLNSFGQTVYIALFFALTFSMIAGFGLMNANISMPASPDDLTPSSGSGPVSIEDALKGLGVDSETEVTPSGPGGLLRIETFLRETRPLLWLVVPGLVFVVVTGIGALCLQMSETNLQNFIKAGDYRVRRRLVAELDQLLLDRKMLARLSEDSR